MSVARRHLIASSALLPASRGRPAPSTRGRRGPRGRRSVRGVVVVRVQAWARATLAWVGRRRSPTVATGMPKASATSAGPSGPLPLNIVCRGRPRRQRGPTFRAAWLPPRAARQVCASGRHGVHRGHGAPNAREGPTWQQPLPLSDRASHRRGRPRDRRPVARGDPSRAARVRPTGGARRRGRPVHRSVAHRRELRSRSHRRHAPGRTDGPRRPRGWPRRWRRRCRSPW